LAQLLLLYKALSAIYRSGYPKEGPKLWLHHIAFDLFWIGYLSPEVKLNIKEAYF